MNGEGETWRRGKGYVRFDGESLEDYEFVDAVEEFGSIWLRLVS